MTKKTEKPEITKEEANSCDKNVWYVTTDGNKYYKQLL